MNVTFDMKLITPQEVAEQYPLTESMKATVEKVRKQVKDILAGRDERKLLIIGPCSSDNEDSVLDYVCRLKKCSEKVEDKILIVPRIYTNKPRTTGEGYKGMLHQPNPNDKPDLCNGIIATRHMHMRTIEETGFACADEMLYPETYMYLDDLLAYVTVGARSVEDQQHRFTASGLDISCGMKNPTSGDYTVMMNGIVAAQNPHAFIYRGWEVHSEGNEYAHAVLRGYTNKHGLLQPNYRYEDIIRLCDEYDARDLKNPALIVDASHSNSNKNPFEQPRIIREVLGSAGHNERIGKLLKGFMVESYIEDGCQPIGGGIYGKSITDPCLGWEKSEELIYEMADIL